VQWHDSGATSAPTSPRNFEVDKKAADQPNKPPQPPQAQNANKGKGGGKGWNNKGNKGNNNKGGNKNGKGGGVLAKPDSEPTSTKLCAPNATALGGAPTECAMGATIARWSAFVADPTRTFSSTTSPTIHATTVGICPSFSALYTANLRTGGAR